MFSFFGKKEDKNIIYAPVSGECVLLSKVNDPTFAEEMIGKGAAIIPSDGKVYAPCDGTVALVFDTKHAISVVSEDGAEVMIHFGLDTVKLKGEPFKTYVEVGDSVKKGDLILEADIQMIKDNGCDIVVPVVITNSFDYSDVALVAEKVISYGEQFIRLAK